jgi:hypothetical protein
LKDLSWFYGGNGNGNGSAHDNLAEVTEAMMKILLE